MEMVKFNIPKKLLPKTKSKEFMLKVSFIVISPKGDIYSVPHHLSFTDSKVLMNNGLKPFSLNKNKHEMKI